MNLYYETRQCCTYIKADNHYQFSQHQPGRCGAALAVAEGAVVKDAAVAAAARTLAC
jgi:hypothetical protein